MPTYTAHNLIIQARRLKMLMDVTTGNEIRVRHRQDLEGGNAILELDAVGMPVNSDQPFNFSLTNAQRARLQQLLFAAGDQPVSIRFNLLTSKLEVSNIQI